MTRILNNLPLSELLRVAIADTRRAMRDPNVRLNMNYWVAPELDIHGNETQVCKVCVAGAVLYCKLEQREEKHTIPTFADRLNTMRLGALPSQRLPRLWLKKITPVVRAEFMHIVLESLDYARDGGRALLKDYMRAATYLERQGL